MVQRLKAKQRGPRCSWCDAKATHRGFMFGKYGCAQHLRDLENWDRAAQAPDYSDAAFYYGGSTNG